MKKRYAEEYTAQEKLRILFISVPLCLLILVSCEIWFFPWISWFASTAHCHELFGITGIELIWSGLFVGFPFFFLFPIGIHALIRGTKIIKYEQYPPVGEQVFQKTVIVTGIKAKIRGYSYYMILPIVLYLMISGYYNANDFIMKSTDKNFDYSVCKAK